MDVAEEEVVEEEVEEEVVDEVEEEEEEVRAVVLFFSRLSLSFRSIDLKKK